MELPVALAARRSVRGFRPDSAPPEVLERIFQRAQHAPSWCNIQPWRVWVTSGDVTKKVADAMTEAASTSAPEPDFPWPYDYPEPYNTHRKECGKALYEAMGVTREDKAGKHAAWMANFRAFGAPHIAIVGLDRRFGLYAALDVGCWLQTVLLLAEEEGLATCAQAALATYPKVLRPILDIPQGIGVLCGIAIGYEDREAPANATRTTRAPVGDNVRFLGVPK